MKKLTFLIALLLAVSLGTVAWAQNPSTIVQRAAGAQRQDGFLPFYWDAARGRLLMEITLDREMIYFVTVAKAAGSVELGLDRGSGGGSRLVHFERQSQRVALVQKNLRFRAPNGNRAVQQVLEDSFASSIIASFPIEAEEQGRFLIDATPFVVRDANNLEATQRQRNEGNYRLDPTRSALYPARTKNYPQNTEVEVTLTYAADAPGPLVGRVAPDGRALTIRLHHSFVQLPEGYRPRLADPRIGVNGGRFKDYSTAYNQDMDVQQVSRFRLEKKDPNAALSEPKKPIIFYLDPSMPALIREASREGVLWWNHAYEAAGFKNAIQVLDAPEDMDPMDSRYNYILWINRDERGFSVGGSISDPRTGETLVAKPRMDSHRIRTIGNYWRNYRMPLDNGAEHDEACGAFLLPYEALLASLAGQAAYSNPKTEEQLVALRQALVTAHEVGHCLGFAHNWTSSINDRASVMEYPSPRVKIVNGQLDLSDAFQRDIGEYDKFMVRYAYTEFPPEREREGLAEIIKEMRSKGIFYTPASDPRWNRYDDLASPAQYLRETLAQRKIMLERYGAEILKPGQPYGDLRGMGLWMTYLHHRWAIDTGVRYIGGMYDNIAVKGETIAPTEIVPAQLQRETLGLLMEVLQPANLTMPERLLPLLASNPAGRDIEEFNLPTGGAFDHLAAARTLSALVLEQLLDAQRAARLVTFADRQANALTLPEVLAAVQKATWNGGAAQEAAKLKSLRRVTQRAALDALMLLGAQAQAAPEVRAVTLEQLTKLRAAIALRHDPDAVTEAHLRQCERDLKRYLENPGSYAPKSNAQPQPAGAPIGMK